MIICGYAGVGKTTLCKQYKKYIDLDSNTFQKDSNWVETYCETVIKLVNDGYDVFVSCHKAVRNYFDTKEIEYITISPTLELEKQWLEKLKKRYFDDTSDANYRAVDRIIHHYTEDITDLLKARNVIVIDNVKYELKTLLNEYMQKRSDNGTK